MSRSPIPFLESGISHKDPDWMTNDGHYQFGPFDNAEWQWALRKRGSTIEVKVVDPLRQKFSATGIDIHAIPPPLKGRPKNQMFVRLIRLGANVDVELNGKRVAVLEEDEG